MTDCYTCTLTQQRDAGKAPLWDNIFRTAYWDLAHSYNTALPGWLVLVTRRHVATIAELNAAEAAELGSLLQRTSQALKEVTGCVKTYVVQFADHPQHPHVHFHIVPRPADQPADKRGLQIMSELGKSAEERVPETQMNKISEQIRQILSVSSE